MPRYLSDLTTREDVQEQVEKASPTSTLSSDFIAYVDSTIHAASMFISNYCNRDFVAYYQDLTIYRSDNEWAKGWAYSPNALRFYLNHIENADLLEVESIAIGGTSLASNSYRLYPANALPAWQLMFDNSVVSLPTSTDFDTSIVIGGTFGYHNNVDQMYTEIETGITIADSTSTSITVADASLYRTWQYIKLEDELMQITEHNDDTNVLTVKRGVNGTTAVAHVSASVSVFNVVNDIRLACTRLVAWAYNNRTDLGTQLQLPDGSVVRNQVPAFVMDTLDAHVRYMYGSV